MEYCKTGWPRKQVMEAELVPYWKVRSSLTVHDGLLLYNDCIVVPPLLWEETLARVHEGHQGIERCRMRAKMCVWWPDISKQLTETVAKCPECAKDVPLQKEPLLPTQLPEYPWQVIGSDLFVLKGDTYLLVVDYYSRCPEVIKLTSTVSASVIVALKTLFVRYGIPEVLHSDNGPQYSAEEFARFMECYGVRHVPSSLRYPQSNGLAERMVRTVKRILKKSQDPYLALLSYRTTPLPWCNLSPSELLMGRRLRTTLPQTTKHLTLGWSYLSDFKRADQQRKEKMKGDFDRSHRVHNLPEIPDDQDVWVSSDGATVPGTVVSQATTPRSYVVQTQLGEIRRNRSHLRVMPPTTQTTETQETEQLELPTRSPIMTRSRTGVMLRPPNRLS